MIAILIVCIIILFYIHLREQFKTSNDLELYEILNPSRIELHELCDIKQPILFNNNELFSILGMSFEKLCTEYGKHEINIRESNNNNNNNNNNKYNNKYKYQITRLEKDTSLANLPPPSTVDFVDITVFTNSQKYTLDFGSTNFYVECNIICDQIFLKWYLREFFKEDLEEPYTCTIMDMDINCITLDANSHVVIKKDAYAVVSNVREVCKCTDTATN